MCVICVKPQGVEIPPSDKLEAMFETNRDGCGFMYFREGADKIVIRKGFMKVKHFKRALKQEGVCKDDTVVMHFRIATAGSVSAGNCHPFPISNEVRELKTTRIETPLAMAHNGILSTVADKDNDMSDTMTFVRDVLASKVVKNNLFDKAILALIEGSIGSNKIVLMNNKGMFYLAGNWVEPVQKDGCFYSNLCWVWRASNPTTVTNNVIDYGAFENRRRGRCKSKAEIKEIMDNFRGNRGVVSLNYPAIKKEDNNFSKPKEADETIPKQDNVVGTYISNDEFMCPECGYPLDGLFQFCGYCGKRLNYYSEFEWGREHPNKNLSV